MSFLRISHELSIIFLRSLFLVLHVLHVETKILDDGVHEADDTCAFGVFLNRARWHFRCWWWCYVRVHADLRKGTCLNDFPLHGVLCLWRSFVQCWIVELLHAIFGLLNKSHRSLTHLHLFHVCCMLLFALLSGICYRLVQGFDGSCQSRNLLHERADGVSEFSELGISLSKLSLGGSLLVCSFLDFIFAVRFLLFILLLLLPQKDNHVINHFLHFIKASSRLQLELGSQGVQHKIEVHIFRLSCNSSQDRLCLACAGGLCVSLLQEPNRLHEGAWESLLEDIKGIVVIQDADGLADRGNLHVAHLGTLCHLLLLGRAITLQSCKEFLSVCSFLICIFKSILGLHHRDSKLSCASHLRLDRLSGHLDFLLLGSFKISISSNCLLLISNRFLEFSLHVVLHGLQNANNLVRSTS